MFLNCVERYRGLVVSTKQTKFTTESWSQSIQNLRKAKYKNMSNMLKPSILMLLFSSMEKQHFYRPLLSSFAVL